MTWPPIHQTYKAFRKELKKACKEYPPFKLWLNKKRNKNLLLSCYPNLKYEPFMHTVNDLKEIYVAEFEKKQNALHMIRFMANKYYNDASDEEKQKLEHVMIQTKMKSTNDSNYF
tara:strand:+ start:318 stop:662 length:345 start_codon:yes stop_codon:yes gene_type:complete